MNLKSPRQADILTIGNNRGVTSRLVFKPQWACSGAFWDLLERLCITPPQTNIIQEIGRRKYVPLGNTRRSLLLESKKKAGGELRFGCA
jgi:hypothetical protein